MYTIFSTFLMLLYIGVLCACHMYVAVDNFAKQLTSRDRQHYEIIKNE